MAITTQLIGTIGAGGGKTFAAAFSNKGVQTRTVGEAGKNYVILARTSGGINGKLSANGILIASGDPGEGWNVVSGPVTITYDGAHSASNTAQVTVSEATAF